MKTLKSVGRKTIDCTVNCVIKRKKKNLKVTWKNWFLEYSFDFLPQLCELMPKILIATIP